MQVHALRVGEELVIPGHIRLTILAVEEGKVVLGITAEPNHVRGPVDRQRRPRLMAVPLPPPKDN
jgi:sRNA-binding carbon storage regulator CsrA